jgi:hypothetical protein
VPRPAATRAPRRSLREAQLTLTTGRPRRSTHGPGGRTPRATSSRRAADRRDPDRTPTRCAPQPVSRHRAAPPARGSARPIASTCRATSGTRPGVERLASVSAPRRRARARPSWSHRAMPSSPAVDEWITACSLHKTNRICRRSRSERIRRDTPAVALQGSPGELVGGRLWGRP